MPEKKAEKKDAKKGGKDARPGNKPGGKKGKGGGLLLLIGVFVAAASALPVTIVAVPGLIPAWVMWLTDKSKGRNMLVAVGVMNLAGVAAVVLNLLHKGFSVTYAVQLLYDPANWIVMWGAAGIGYALYRLAPPMAAQVLATAAEFRAQKLRKNQEEMRRMWGEEVKGVNSER